MYNIIIGKSWENDTRVRLMKLPIYHSSNSRAVILDGLINYIDHFKNSQALITTLGSYVPIPI